ncbi:pol polyprotein [Tanacetum coccineum]
MRISRSSFIFLSQLFPLLLDIQGTDIRPSVRTFFLSMISSPETAMHFPFFILHDTGYLADGILGKRDVLSGSLQLWIRAVRFRPVALNLMTVEDWMAIPHTDIELTTVIQAAVQSYAPSDSRIDSRKNSGWYRESKTFSFPDVAHNLEMLLDQRGIAMSLELIREELYPPVYAKCGCSGSESVSCMPGIASSAGQTWPPPARCARRETAASTSVSLTRKPDISGRVFAIMQNQTTNISEELPGISSIRDGLKDKVQELLGHGFISTQVYHQWDDQFLFVKEKDGNMRFMYRLPRRNFSWIPEVEVFSHNGQIESENRSTQYSRVAGHYHRVVDKFLTVGLTLTKFNDGDRATTGTPVSNCYPIRITCHVSYYGNLYSSVSYEWRQSLVLTDKICFFSDHSKFSIMRVKIYYVLRISSANTVHDVYHVVCSEVTSIFPFTMSSLTTTFRFMRLIFTLMKPEAILYVKTESWEQKTPFVENFCGVTSSVPASSAPPARCGCHGRIESWFLCVIQGFSRLRFDSSHDTAGFIFALWLHVLGDGILGKRDVLRMRVTLRLTLLYGLPQLLFIEKNDEKMRASLLTAVGSLWFEFKPLGVIDDVFGPMGARHVCKMMWRCYGEDGCRGKGKSEYLAPKAGIVKQKFQGTCYNCDQPGHRTANCKIPKRVNPRQANMVDENVDMIAMVSDVCAMISEVNLVGTNNSGWWIDTGATRHVCADKSMFHSFRAVDNGQKLYMGNSATADIKGEGDVILKMTSEKELKLTNVLYVPEIRKNLVSGWLLNKFGFRLVFESDKFVLSKNQMYVGRGYAMNGMFKLNVMVVKNEINKMNSSAYLIESSNVWHGRLGHYCYVYLLKSKDEAIDKFVLYKTKVENQLGKKIKVVRSDRGGEYVASFAELCAKSCV